MKTTLVLILALWCAGCASASLVRRTYEPEKGGVVKFKNSLFGGQPSAQKARAIMASYCAPGDYNVIQEQDSLETIAYSSNTSGTLNGNSYNGTTNVTPVNRSYVYVQFRCEQSRSTASEQSE